MADLWIHSGWRFVCKGLVVGGVCVLGFWRSRGDPSQPFDTGHGFHSPSQTGYDRRNVRFPSLSYWWMTSYWITSSCGWVLADNQLGFTTRKSTIYHKNEWIEHNIYLPKKVGGPPLSGLVFQYCCPYVVFFGCTSHFHGRSVGFSAEKTPPKTATWIFLVKVINDCPLVRHLTSTGEISPYRPRNGKLKGMGSV